MSSRVGKLLIANPNFPSISPFSKTVIYVYQDDDKVGTIGLILNKPAVTTVAEFCDDNGIMFPNDQASMHKGGPVSTTAIILLHTDEWESTNTVRVGNRLSITSDNHMLEKMSTGNMPAYWRAFYGVSAWHPGQLDKEIEGQEPFVNNMWLTAEPTDSVLFEYDGGEQWVRAVELCSQQTIDHFF
jgi:putative AlgH/UPF0301 family transcriptional regulator